MALPQFIARFDQRRALRNACVIDQYVNRPQALSDIGQRQLDALPLGNVAGRRHCLGPGLSPDLFRHARHFCFSPGQHGYARPLTRKRKSDGAPNPAPSPSN
jgi:hypothetical protein